MRISNQIYTRLSKKKPPSMYQRASLVIEKKEPSERGGTRRL